MFNYLYVYCPQFQNNLKLISTIIPPKIELNMRKILLIFLKKIIIKY